MARRRMFSPDIVCSDAFLDMPTSSRELYFQLGMKADDDGFVNPRGTMRMCGASEDDLKLIITKRFVLPFENGVIVIKHWKINNLVRKDWYRPTQYIEQKKTLYIKENGSYTEDCNQGTLLVNESLTQVRLGKVINTNTSDKSESKKIMKTYNEKEHSDSDEEIIDFDSREIIIPAKKASSPKKGLQYKAVFDLFGTKTFASLGNRKNEIEAAKTLIEVRGMEQIEKAIKYSQEHKNEEYCPKVFGPSDLLMKWDKLLAYKEKHG